MKIMEKKLAVIGGIHSFLFWYAAFMKPPIYLVKMFLSYNQAELSHLVFRLKARGHPDSVLTSMRKHVLTQGDFGALNKTKKNCSSRHLLFHDVSQNLRRSVE